MFLFITILLKLKKLFLFIEKKCIIHCNGVFIFIKISEKRGLEMFFSNKNHRLNDSKQKFSIRKYKLGTFSVLVGTLFYMTSISNIQAQEVKDSNISVEIKPKIDKNEEKEHKRENETNKENNLLDDHSKQEDVKDKKDNFLQFQQELEAILQEGRLIASKVQGVEKMN